MTDSTPACKYMVDGEPFCNCTECPCNVHLDCPCNAEKKRLKEIAEFGLLGVFNLRQKGTDL